MTSAASFPTTPTWFALIAAETTNTAEIVLVTNVTGTTLTVTRNFEPQPWAPVASAHASGAVFSVAAVAAPVFSRPGALLAQTDATQLGTVDPHVAGLLWSNAGVITRSAG